MQHLLFPPRPPRKLIVVGCGKSKRSEVCEAQNLYTGTLTRDRIRYAQAQVAQGLAVQWAIASAWYKLLAPTDEIHPYEMTLSDLPEATRKAWAWEVGLGIAEAVRLRGIELVEIHASSLYAELIVEGCEQHRVWEVLCPLEGLSLPQSRAWYSANTTQREAA